MSITFTVYGKPEPQGSSRAFIIGGKARITSANAKLKPFRQRLTAEAIQNCCDMMPYFKKHVPLQLTVVFTFLKPPSSPKKRGCVVKPDLDKLVRAVGDALTGSVWHDDAQVISISASKRYGSIEATQITVEEGE